MQVLFIATANTMATVPPTLRDRMEVIEVPGYTQEDKLQIAKRHLISKQLEVRFMHLQHTSLSLQRSVETQAHFSESKNAEDLLRVALRPLLKLMGG